MADEQVAIDLVINGDRANLTLKELEDGFDLMSKRLKEVGRGSEEFKTLSTAMAQTSAEIKNIELAFEGLDREQVAGELGSVAGGIGDITASLVLLGGENETIEQIGASIEKAMAISMGFKGAIEGLSSAQKLYNNLLKEGKIAQAKETITTSIATAKTWLLNAAKKVYATTTGVLTGKIKIATVAQKVFNAAAKANPIGILITVIAAAGAAFLAFAKDTSKAAKEQKALSDSLEAVSGELESVYEEVNQVENAFDLARKGVISKEEALKTYNETVGQTIGEAETLEEAEKKFSDNTEAYVKAATLRAQAQELIKMAAQEQTDALLASEEDNRAWYESTVGFLNDAGAAFADYSTLGVLGLSEASDKLNEKINDAATERLVNEKQANAETYKELAKSLNEQLALIETNNNFLRESDKEAVKKTAEETKKANESQLKKLEEAIKKEKEASDRRAKIREEERKQLIEDAKDLAEFEEEQAKIKIALIQDEGERARAEIEYNTQLELEALEQKGLLTFDAEMLIAQKKHKALAELEKTEEDKRLEADKEAQAKIDELKDQAHQKELARIDEEKAARDEARQLAFDLTLNTLNAISEVSNAYADRDLKAEEDRFNNLRATKQLTEKQLAAEEEKSAGIKDAIRKRQFENDKKMQIAMAAINGAQALTSIFAQYPKFDGGFAMIAALASSVITTAATIAKIKATTFTSTPAPALPTLDSGDVSADGAGAAGGGAAITPVTNTSTILGGQQVFVTETDITETQNNVSVIEESATF